MIALELTDIKDFMNKLLRSEVFDHFLLQEAVITTGSTININGQITKDETVYNFWANRDAAGNVNVSGVPASLIAEVAEDVAEIIAEVEAIAIPTNED